MTDTLQIFVHQDSLIPLEELYELTGNEDIDVLQVEDIPFGYRVKWSDVVVTIEQLSLIHTQQALQAVLDYVEHALSDRTDSKARKHVRRVESAQQVLKVTIDPAPDTASKAKNLILGVVTFYEGSFFFARQALYNEAGKRFFGGEHTPPRYFLELTPEDSPEAIARKERSLTRLHKEKIPFIKHLPVIADHQQAVLRDAHEIAQRLLALVLIADKAEGETTAIYEQRVLTYGLQEAVTPDEWTYAHEETPIKQDTIKFSQRVESAWVLAWVLGWVDLTPRPDVFCDVDRLRELVQKHTVVSLAKGKLRAIEDILDETDLMYRYHWAVNDAELYGTRIPGKFLPPVTYERHYALNWLIGYQGQPWDTVSTDT